MRVSGCARQSGERVDRGAGAETVQTLLKNAQKPTSGLFASVVAFITLLGASGVFTELQDALNVIWDVKGQSASGAMGMIKQRLFLFGMVLSSAFFCWCP